ncbi:hypothetical protein GCM10007940_13350 [Portibacter lacus]|uniref:Dockerin domain-containing protein n=2 Tax=Portibacter lacus TaxID=1099794 RepID=A0AA37SMY9_9BACT|nr:hypothetical protein GCM10007940_13350 [Portibacter lacus]
MRGVNVASSLFLFLSLFFSVNLSGQAAPSCVGSVNISPDPALCSVDVNVATFGLNADVVYIDGLPAAALTGNGTATVNIDVTLIPAFQASGMVMDITYSLIQGTVDAPTNSCWGVFALEDKAPPAIVCAPDVTIDCDDYVDDGTIFITPTVGGMVASIIECTTISIDSSDARVNEMCVMDVITRTYRVTDRKGNVATCSQSVTLNPEDLADLSLPPFYDGLGDRDGVVRPEVTINGVAYTVVDSGMIQCSDLALYNLLANGHPSPDPSASNPELLYTGRPGGFECGTINAEFEDLRIEICYDAGEPCLQNNPSFKVVREWTILDWCSGDILEYNQIIKVADTIAPVATELPDVTISTDLWGCGATYTLPAAAATDNCSASSAITASYGSSEGTIVGNVLILPSVAKTMPGEEVEVYVNYSDCCGNTSIDTFLVTVADMVPPVVVADAHTVVSLSQYNEGGLAKIYASTFDDGSHDGCGPIAMSVQRMGSACSGDLPGEGVIPGDDDDLENEDGTDDSETGATGLWFDYVHFCCEDVQFDENGDQIPVMVVFRVCDDANMDGEIGNTGDYCNTAMVEVIVQDKLPPACAVPANTSINCIDLVAIQDLVDAGPLSEADVAKVNALFGESIGAATCNVEQSVQLTGGEVCGDGEIERTVVVTNTVNGKTATCTQTIDVVVLDENILSCDDITFPAGSPEATVVNPDNSIGYHWCDTNYDQIDDTEDGTFVETQNFGAITIDNCDGVTITPPVVNIDNLCSEVGINLSLDTFNFNGGGCKKILAHWEIIDQCVFQENYLHKPSTDPKTWEVNPFVAENGYFELYVEYDLFDTEGPIIECGDGAVVGCGETLTGALTATATDACTTDSQFFGWSWRLDVDADGDIDAQGEGSSVTPADLGLTSFPEGNHIITWIVSDGCGNISSKDCPFGLEIKDEKAPTPYCYDGLASAVMLGNGSVTMWASDFDRGSFDACTDVTVTILPEQDVVDETDNPRANLEKSKVTVTNVTDGETVYGWEFGCEYIANGVAATIDVRLYVEDEAGNFDYCTASFRLQDNLGGCPDVDGALLNVGGKVATEEGNSVDNVVVEAMAANPEFPKYANTDADGNYAFNNNPAFLSYEISSVRDDSHMNGVSTLDLVLIQKHILNIESLDSPYKRIAADINNDGSIKVADLLQLRKLILGLYNENKLPSNEAWRFVDADFQFADASNPFPFDEVINIESLETDVMSENFVAIKVGDVNSNVSLSSNTNATVRSNKAVTFDLNNADFAAGEIVELEFTSADFNEVYGYQFTLEFAKGLTFNDIVPGALNVTEANFGLNKISEGVITTSYDNVRGATVDANEVLFTVKFTATTAGSLSDMINVSSKNTAAEAYVGASLEVSNVDATFRTNENNAASYALYQNEPNPFKGATVIGYELPSAANATLKVYDVTGKVLYTTTETGVKGFNSITVQNLNASGVLYYQLDSDDFTATKKMIIIE